MSFYLLLISGVISAIGTILCKKAASDKFSPFSFALAFQFWNIVVAIPLLLINFKIPIEPQWWLVMFASACLFTISMAFYFKAFETSDASVVSLIGRLSILVAAVGGILFNNDPFNLQILFALFLIVSGTSVICFEKTKLKITKGMLAAFGYAIVYGLVAFLDKQVIGHFSAFSYPFFNNLVTISLLLLISKTRNEAIAITKTKPLIIIFAGGLNLISWATYLFALSGNVISKAFSIWDSTILVTVMLIGILFLSEKQRLVQKLLGAALAIGGIFLLS
jgi:drug/metabolite transporter (DMT)-like permease